MINQSLQEIILSRYNSIPVIFLGNGINRITNDNLSWNEVLNNLIKVSGSAEIRKENKPLTFLFEEILHSMKGGATRENEQNLKEAVAVAIDNAVKPNDTHKKFMNLNIDHFLTTNYDYCLERVLDPNFRKIPTNKQDGESKKHSLSRYNKVNDKFIWHIHGELDNGLVVKGNNYPEKSIMLGFDQYIRTLMKMSHLLNNGSYRNLSGKQTLYEVFSNFLNVETKERSWLSFFFTNDIHIVALDLGVHETHLWWLMHYREKLAAREHLIYKNRITYYVSPFERLFKRDHLELLQSLDVIVAEVKCDYNGGSFYREFYENACDLISLSV